MGWQESSLDWLKFAMREWHAGNLRVAVIAAYTSIAEACEGYMRSEGKLPGNRRFKFDVALAELRKQMELPNGLWGLCVEDQEVEILLELYTARCNAVHHPYTAPHKSRVYEMIGSTEGLLFALGVDV